ncbi:aminoacyl-tRNA hydrolase [Bradymonadaceae bacterium TMQ3]|uniref:Peptidyl-tRNA hydrolase n=1 Tax=Lujinxingia sediminis TaxID=2480984 RepID=A0ABY0CX31_9DELT|nr:aminoacyl-tRNA hydrolase [Lujinxingia sediminis]RDV40142.1 aminoacyl-tRNA hydrolase [Bradymonadaceae bacterium TMQ3]RVU48169.1 aminoacyl-tRNA hydrolase [Lujinxingia sediminis]TXC77469.1 aminoacyl-tRNA hydrolase [Bradymonadales bacterium TMQ1]
MSRTLIVGLGNPGPKYEGTRHNIGFAAVDALAQRYQMTVTQSKFHGVYTTGIVAGHDVALLKPLTFMNLSGKSVAPALSFFHVTPDRLIVLHDELDVELGQMKIKEGGGHGGHNGLRDIVAKTGTREFVRLRLGIGRPEHGDVTNHVLGRFRPDETLAVDRMLDDACDAVEVVLNEGVAVAQNRFHGR